jgi:hypothetical protein
VASIDRTAYPRFKRVVSVRERLTRHYPTTWKYDPEPEEPREDLLHRIPHLGGRRDTGETASFIATVGMLAHQRRSASSTSLLEESTRIRICVASAIFGSSAALANALLI